MSETTTTDAQEAAQPDAEQQAFTADYVAKLRAENANYRTKAKENAKAADELAALRDANKSEAEKLAESLAKAQQEAQDWQQRYQSQIVRDHVITAATNARAIDAETVYLHLQANGLEVDDHGNPAGITEAVEALRTSKPHLFNAAPAGAADAGAKGKNYALNDFDALTRDLMGAVGSNPQ